ncbi:glycosyltransferase family 61 protein [Spirosoma spitsbergense]|uniref:glycosyltransferase family 61 protein n=1 Tax=Spirosoma spitsbergense TaxID=431554 RepID=UPI000373B860|nr:glycosyltransferase family 61 protein [Spirosoma spitsbergense]
MANPVKRLLGKLTRLLLKSFRLELLSKEETVVYLNNFQIDNNSQTCIELPDVPNQSDGNRLIFTRTNAVTHPAYVWHVDDTTQTTQLPYGGIRANGKMLCTDFQTFHLVKNFLGSQKRTVVTYDLLLAPWSHFSDGIIFGGYYDFVMLVAAKLCRMKEALLPEIVAKAVISYPLFQTAYEQEFLSLIGIAPDQVFDSRTHDVRFKECVLGNSGHWFYPNPADIRALKKQVEKQIRVQPSAKNRIYVSRAGRRRVINEASLIDLLRKYDFTVVEDKPRSVTEQVAIYKNASFILGPHGASFTNIIWCEPGAHLFELFAPTMIVDHFRYLSRIMNMNYSAYHHVLTVSNKKKALEEDIFISIPDLERCLDELLGKPEAEGTDL